MLWLGPPPGRPQSPQLVADVASGAGGALQQKCVKPGEDQRSAVLLRGAFQVALEIKNPPTCQGRRHKRLGFDPWVRKIP